VASKAHFPASHASSTNRSAHSSASSGPAATPSRSDARDAARSTASIPTASSPSPTSISCTRTPTQAEQTHQVPLERHCLQAHEPQEENLVYPQLSHRYPPEGSAAHGQQQKYQIHHPIDTLGALFNQRHRLPHPLRSNGE
jgi:hypothetical protein